MSRASTTSSMGQQLMQSVGIGLAATLLHFISQWRGEARLTWDSVTPAFAVIGMITFVSLLWYARLPADAGSVLHARPRHARA
jgi:hypothetical protein